LIGDDEFRIRIKRNDEDFVVSIYTLDEFVLKGNNGKIVKSIKADDRIIFTDVKPGLYFLENYNNNKITIRVK
jgi:hypothetical protein